jgi:hypothetical protein
MSEGALSTFSFKYSWKQFLDSTLEKSLTLIHQQIVLSTDKSNGKRVGHLLRQTYILILNSFDVDVHLRFSYRSNVYLRFNYFNNSELAYRQHTHKNDFTSAARMWISQTSNYQIKLLNLKRVPRLNKSHWKTTWQFDYTIDATLGKGEIRSEAFSFLKKQYTGLQRWTLLRKASRIVKSLLEISKTNQF